MKSIFEKKSVKLFSFRKYYNFSNKYLHRNSLLHQLFHYVTQIMLGNAGTTEFFSGEKPGTVDIKNKTFYNGLAIL